MNEDATMVHVGVLCTTLCVCSSALGFLPSLRRALMLPKSAREGMATVGYLRLSVDVAVAAAGGEDGGEGKTGEGCQLSESVRANISIPSSIGG